MRSGQFSWAHTGSRLNNGLMCMGFSVSSGGLSAFTDWAKAKRWATAGVVWTPQPATRITRKVVLSQIRVSGVAANSYGIPGPRLSREDTGSFSGPGAMRSSNPPCGVSDIPHTAGAYAGEFAQTPPPVQRIHSVVPFATEIPKEEISWVAFDTHGIDDDGRPDPVVEMGILLRKIAVACCISMHPETGVAIWEPWQGFDVKLYWEDSKWSVHEYVTREANASSYVIARRLRHADINEPYENREQLISIALRHGLSVCVSGSNGSWTRSDDVKLTKAQKKAMTIQGTEYAARAMNSLTGNHIPTDALLKAARQAGSYASRLFGFGSVKMDSHNFSKVSTNSLIKGSYSVDSSFGGETCEAKSCDTVCEIRTGPSTGDNPYLITLPIQPADKNRYTKTADLAAAYGQWCPKGIVFKFESAYADFSSTGPIGVMVVGYQPNSLRPAPTTLSDMYSLDLTTQFKLNENWGFALECDPKLLARRCYTTRRDATVTGESLNDSDMGILYIWIAPAGSSADVLIGTLWSDWNVMYSKPTQANSLPGIYREERTSFGNATPLGTVQSTLVRKGVCSALAVSSSTAFYFYNLRKGAVVYFTVVWYNGSSLTVTVPTVTFTNCLTNNVFNGGTSYYQFTPVAGGTSSVISYRACVTINAAPNQNSYATFSTGGVIAASSSYVDISVEAVGVGLTAGASL